MGTFILNTPRNTYLIEFILSKHRLIFDVTKIFFFTILLLF